MTGFAANYGGGEAAGLVIAKHFSRFLIGEDPFNIEKIWDQMYRATLPYGLGGVTAMAISGVDLALWDLMGKALRQPVYKLLGGQTKDSNLTTKVFAAILNSRACDVIQPEL